ncbi:MAG TPA: biopolymer transporter ExbD [Kiritimatiellia bacterium]|nr:biopolymer transporter ExbD [Kiritimatiellia bacterium]HRZ11985.1 biopolymer transporter ExbD [Kiritimatiellia bacterium]HSA17209.1 biopolymer transporter ExbD [Kiritimatiellia bacterium]
MARRTSILALQEMREINMTPLIDLTFLLLITFIITFPLLEQGIYVNLPRGKADDLDQRQMRTITLDIEGQLFLDRQPVTRDALAAEMTEMGRADPETIVMVRADEKIAYGKLVEILNILREAKIARMALVTSPDGK